MTTIAAAARALPPLARASVERPLLGIGLILLSMLVFSVMDGLSKALTVGLHPVQVTWGRFVVVTLLLVPMLLLRRQSLGTARPGRHVLRGIAMLGSSLFFVYGLAHLPLADAAAIGFAAPLIITALSIPLLGEKVGVRRWSAVLVGFAGVVVVIRPGSGGFDPAAVFPLCSAASWAFGLIITRQMQASEPVLTTLALSTFVGAVIVSGLVPFFWTPIEPREWALLGLLGVLSTVGQIFLINAFRFAGASLLSPFTYSQMLWATTIGWVGFGQLPDLLTWTGAAIIIGSGVYTLHRERVRARERSRAQ